MYLSKELTSFYPVIFSKKLGNFVKLLTANRKGIICLQINIENLLLKSYL